MFKKLFVIILFAHLTLSQDDAATTTTAAVEQTTMQSTTAKPQSDQQTQTMTTTETTRKPFRILSLVGDGMVGVLEAKIDFLQRQSNRIKKLFSIR